MERLSAVIADMTDTRRIGLASACKAAEESKNKLVEDINCLQEKLFTLHRSSTLPVEVSLPSETEVEFVSIRDRISQILQDVLQINALQTTQVVEIVASINTQYRRLQEDEEMVITERYNVMQMQSDLWSARPGQYGTSSSRAGYNVYAGARESLDHSIDKLSSKSYKLAIKKETLSCELQTFTQISTRLHFEQAKLERAKERVVRYTSLAHVDVEDGVLIDTKDVSAVALPKLDRGIPSSAISESKGLKGVKSHSVAMPPTSTDFFILLRLNTSGSGFVTLLKAETATVINRAAYEFLSIVALKKISDPMVYENVMGLIETIQTYSPKVRATLEGVKEIKSDSGEISNEKYALLIGTLHNLFLTGDAVFTSRLLPDSKDFSQRTGYQKTLMVKLILGELEFLKRTSIGAALMDRLEGIQKSDTNTYESPTIGFATCALSAMHEIMDFERRRKEAESKCVIA